MDATTTLHMGKNNTYVFPKPNGDMIFLMRRKSSEPKKEQSDRFMYVYIYLCIIPTFQLHAISS